MGSSTNRFASVNIYAGGTLRFFTANGSANKFYVQSNKYNVSMFLNDSDSAIAYIGLDGTTNALGANSVAYWLDSEFVVSGRFYGGPRDTTNGLGRVGVASWGPATGLDVLVDNLVVSEITTSAPPVEVPLPEGLLLFEDYETGSIGSCPTHGNPMLTGMPADTNSGIRVVDAAMNTAATGKAIQLYDNDTSTAMGLEYNLVTNGVGLSAVRADFTFSWRNIVSGYDQFLSVSFGEYNSSASRMLGGTARRYTEARLGNDGTVDFFSATSGTNINNALTPFAANTMTIFANDYDSQSVNYTTNGTTYSLPANSVAYWLNGSLIMFGASEYASLDLSKTNAAGATIGTTENNLGKFGFSSSAVAYGLDYIVDNISASELVPNMLTITSGGRSFRRSLDGSVVPSSQSYTISNAASTSLDWTVTPAQSWVTVTPSGGTLPEGGSSDITVSINAAADELPGGIYTNTLIFGNSLDAGPQTRAIQLTTIRMTNLVMQGPTQLVAPSTNSYTCWAQGSDGSISNMTVQATWSLVNEEPGVALSTNGVLSAGDITSNTTITVQAVYGGVTNTLPVALSVVAHLGFSVIASPQSAGTPFEVTLSAQDINGTTISAYRGGVVLSGAGDNGPVALTPATAVLSNGVCTVSIRINTADNNIRLTASDGLGRTGLSDAFDVLAGPVDHFTWSTIPNPQYVGAAFPVTVTARDAANNTANNFSGSVTLSGPPTGILTNRIMLTDLGYNYTGSGTYTRGVRFQPTKNITVTHFRHFWGTKVSIWTDSGVLVATKNVASVNGTWLETPLDSPVVLTSGTVYRIAGYAAGGTYYYRNSDMPTNFTDGVILNGAFSNSGDTFPVSITTSRYLVDMRYTVGADNITPTNIGNFAGGTWNGNVTVLEATSNMYLRADDGGGHSGTSGLFRVEAVADVGITMTDSPDPVIGRSNLTYTVTVSNSGPDKAAGVLVSDSLPATVNFVSASASQGACTNAGGTVTWNVGVVSNGAIATASIVVMPTVNGTLTNTVTLTANVTDSNATNNVASTVTSAQGVYYYTLTVNNGNGGGSYTNGRQVAIAADAPSTGKAFRWVGDTQYVNGVTSSTTTVTMPAKDITLTATYENLPGWYTLTVNSGFGSGVYSNGVQVAIAASDAPPGRAFDRWIGNTNVLSSNTVSTTVTMPVQDITLTATYTNLPGYYTLTVTNGSGSGAYTNTQVVAISANAISGKAFVQWTGDTQYVASASSANTMVTMLAQAVTLTATYVDVCYTLWNFSGTGTGSYTNGTRVAIVDSNAVPSGKVFDQWTGSGAPYVANVTASNTTVTMPSSNIYVIATYKDITYALTVNNGSGSGSYTNGQQVAISADAPAETVFHQWIGDTQVVNNVTYTNALVTMSTNPVSLTATYYYVYTLTVNGGTIDGGLYTNGTQVEITADAPAAGMTFDQWTGDTQYVNNVTYTNALVTMPAQAVALSATYKNLPGWYTLTVSNGIGGGAYTNGAQVLITAVAPDATAFDRWIGDNQYVDKVFSPNAIVTMPAQNVALTAACVDATNGIASVDWGASVGFYFSVDGGAGILGPNGSGKSTIVQLMYSPDDVKDDILPSGAGAVNDVVWDASIITENGDGITEWAQMLSRVSTVRTWTNGYVYGLIFQDDNVEPGDWYFFSSPMLALEKKQVGDAAQDLEINTPDAIDYFTGDPIDGGPNNAQVIEGFVLTVNNGSGSGWYTNEQQVAISANVPASGKVFDKWIGDTQYVNNVTYTNALVTMSTNAVTLTATYKDAAVHLLTASAETNGTISPASTNVPVGGSATFTITASNYYRIASLTTNGTAVTGMSFDNGSTTTNFTWTNVQTSGVLVATFTAQVANDPAHVPYEWLAQRNLTNYNTDAEADQDLDGLKAWQEYIAGTDPTNKASCLRVTEGPRNVISWNAVSGRVYSVYWTTNLMNGFQPLGMNIAWPQSSFTNPTAASRGYYKIDVRLAAMYTDATYILTVNNGSNSGSYTNGQQVMISANAPAAGKAFSQWVGDVAYVDNATYTNALVTMSTNPVTLTATYTDIYYTLTGSAGANGTVSPTSTNVLSGGSVDLIVTASNYYRIASLTVNGTPAGLPFDNNSVATNYMLGDVRTNIDVAAIFTEQVANDPANTPYLWLAGYGLTNSGSTFNQAATADPDGDGLTAWQEYIAGTDPTNAASYLRVTEAPRNVVGWNAVSGRVYSVYWTTNLMNGFQCLESNIPWTRGGFTNPTTVPQGFYKIDVRLE